MKSRFTESLTRPALLQNTRLQNTPFQGTPAMELRARHHNYLAQPFSMELVDYDDQIRTIALAFFIVGLVAITSSLSFEAWLLNPAIIKKNALLELAQSMFLILAALLQAWRAFNTQESNLIREIHRGLALFIFALFLCEVNEEFISSSMLWNLLETTIQLITLLAIFGFAMHMSRVIKLVTGNLTQILLSPTILLSIIACVFYVCSFPFHRELFAMNKNLAKWFEETLELNACLLFFCAGLAGNIKSAAVKNINGAVPSPGCHEQSSQ